MNEDQILRSAILCLPSVFDHKYDCITVTVIDPTQFDVYSVANVSPYPDKNERQDYQVHFIKGPGGDYWEPMTKSYIKHCQFLERVYNG